MKFLSLYIFLLLTFISTKVNAEDPFTRNLGNPEPVVQEEKPADQVEEKKPEPEQVVQEPQQSNDPNQNINEVENILKAQGSEIAQNEPTQPVQETATQTQTTQVAATPIKEKVPIKKSRKDDYISKIVNIDPVVGYDLKSYKLKGVAVSKKFGREKKQKVFTNNYLKNRKNVDLGIIPTTHLIKPGEDLDAISKKYGFTKQEMEIANAIIPGKNIIIPGNRLVIPNRFHKVLEGETISEIAEAYSLDPAQVAAFNNLGVDENIIVDQKLLLPFYVHVTNKDQTIGEIAKAYKRSVKEILDANNLNENQLIAPNQFVKIPIHVNHEDNFENLNIKSVLDYSINPKNLAIVEVSGAQFMVREGDFLGKKDGKIVSIKKNQMIVVEKGREFLFKINAPLSGSASVNAAPVVPTTPVVPGQPGQNTQPAVTPDTGTNSNAQPVDPVVQSSQNQQTQQTQQEPAGTNDVVSDVEELFR